VCASIDADNGRLQSLRNREHGDAMVEGSLSIAMSDGSTEAHFNATAMRRQSTTLPMPALAGAMRADGRVAGFHLSHCRN